MTVPILREINSIRTDITLGGSSGAFVVETNDGELFVVKPHNPGVDKWLAPNELLAGLLGRAINGPFLEPHLVEIDQELLEFSGLRNHRTFAASNLQPGLGFSIKFYEVRQDGTLSKTDLIRLKNPEQALPVLLIDSWLRNIDRNNNGNLIFVPDSFKKRPNYTMFAIDQGLAFQGYSWTAKELHQTQKGVKVEDHLQILNDLAWKHCKKHLPSFLNKVEAITRTELVTILDQIPPAWGVRQSAKVAITNYLLSRQPLLRRVFESFFSI